MRRSDDHTTNQRWPRSAVALLIAIVALAGFIRFTGLSANDFWVDESCTYFATHHLFNLPSDGPQLTSEVAHLPYFLLLRGWSDVAGETPVGLRSFSALIGCAGVLAIAWLAWTLGGLRTCLIAASLAALHPLLIHYSQEARVYSLWILEGALCVAFLYKAAVGLKTSHWLAYAALAFAAVMTHYYTLLWLPATATTVIIARDRKRFIKQWLIAHGVLALALVPVIWFFVLPVSEGGPRPWLRATWQSIPPYLAVVKSLWTMLSSGDYPAYLGATAAAQAVLMQRAGVILTEIVRFLPALIVTMLVIGALLGLVTADKRADVFSVKSGQSKAIPNSSMIVLWLLMLASSFLLTCWIWSALIRPIYVVGRYDVFAIPAVVVAVALLISKPITIKRCENHKYLTFLSVLLTALLVTCSAAVVWASKATTGNRDISVRAARIAQHLDANDLLICIGASRWFMTYEWDHLGVKTRLVSFPRAHDRQLCWDDPDAESAQPQQLVADLNEIADLVGSTLEHNQNIWLLLRGESADARWQVDQRFFSFVRARGLVIEPVDEDAGLARLRPQAKEP